MRRRIRLTGRRQLAKSCIDVKVHKPGDKKLVSMTIVDGKRFEKMPDTAQVKLRLFENKLCETLDFGTLKNLQTHVEVKNEGVFSAPSCQLRVVSADKEHKGRILGSTDTWTLHLDDEDGNGKTSESLLHFQSRNIAPLIWKLEIRDDEYPIVCIDEKIPDERTWAKSDPIFASCVFPAIIRELFDDLLASQPEQEWANKWFEWAETLMPGKTPPWDAERSEKQDWIDHLLAAFCAKHDMLERLVGKIERETAE